MRSSTGYRTTVEHCLPAAIPLHGGRGAGQQHNGLGPEATSMTTTGRSFGKGHFETGGTGEGIISAEDIFAYTYAVLHDPVYRYDYKNRPAAASSRACRCIMIFDDWARIWGASCWICISISRARSRIRWNAATRTSPSSGSEGDWAPKPTPPCRQETRRYNRIDDQTTLSGVPESTRGDTMSSATAPPSNGFWTSTRRRSLATPLSGRSSTPIASPITRNR